jgi:hypothetical protein
MPRTTKKHRVVKKRYFILGFFVALGFLGFGYKLYGDYRFAKESGVLAAEIDALGIKLDKLDKAFIDNGVYYESKRIKYCYRAARKFEKGPIYCIQEIKYIKQLSSDTVVFEKVKAINDIIDAQPDGFVVDQEPSMVFIKGRISGEYSLDRVGNLSSCTGSVVGRNSEVVSPEYRHLIEFEIKCVKSEFDSFIYPER